MAAAATPREAIRGIALGVFDAIDAHPWVGAQLSREPWQTAMLQIFERIGRQVQALGVPGGPSSLRVGAPELHPRRGRPERRERPPAHRPDDRRRSSRAVGPVEAARPREYPFTRQVAAQLREHDDREQFLAGIDLILAGIATVR